jgi:phosphotransferase system HPr-like phosphotransfer protein
MTTYISLDFSFNQNNTTLILPITGLRGKIDWGDGNITTYSSSTNNPSKLYTNFGVYNVKLIDITNLTGFGSSSSNINYRIGLTNFSYLIKIPTLTVLSYLFFSCSNNFTINFASNVTSNVTAMDRMFNSASSFNQPITLDCSSCTLLIGFLNNAASFNSQVTLTNTSKVTSMLNMFFNASSFNQPITLDCSSCTTLEAFLQNATSFNSPITLTNTSKVTTMFGMFYLASSFNQPITFNTSSCTNLRSFLNRASSFNQPITLDCSSCTTLRWFLIFGTSFNSPITLTNTSKVTTMYGMFSGASSFNQPITLDCSSCTTLETFLQDAYSFNSPLVLTPITNLVNATNMLNNTNLSVDNYSDMLILWGNQSNIKNNTTLDASGIEYNIYAVPFRNNLINKNWVINDGGLEENTPSNPVKIYNYEQLNYVLTTSVLYCEIIPQTMVINAPLYSNTKKNITGNNTRLIFMQI